MAARIRGLASVAVSTCLLAATPAHAAPVQHPSGQADAPADDPEVAPEDGSPEPTQPEPTQSESPEPAPSEPELLGTGPVIEPVDIVPPPAPERPKPEPEPEPEPELEYDEDLDYDDDDGFDDDYDLLRDSPEGVRARRWLGAGIGAVATGALLVGGALAMGLTDACAKGNGNNCFVDARNRAAATLGVPGGLLLLGGIAMITVGSVQRQRLAASVSVSAQRVGVILVGRF